MRPDANQTVRLTVPEAAEHLGITVEAVRGRIKRQTLRSVKDENGAVHVLLDASQSRPAVDQSTDRPPDQSALIASMHDQIEFLRRELERKDAILLRMAERIPELEPASEPREAPETATVEEAEQQQRRPPEEPRRGFWRRLLGS